MNRRRSELLVVLRPVAALSISSQSSLRQHMERNTRMHGDSPECRQEISAGPREHPGFIYLRARRDWKKSLSY
jgi:hypothetical protein